MKAILIAIGLIVALCGLGYAGLWLVIDSKAQDGSHSDADGNVAAVSSAAMGLCGVGLVVLAERLL